MDPHFFRRSLKVRNGVEISLRAIRPTDRDRLRKAFDRLDPRTIYTRFFGVRRGLSKEELTAATEVDFKTVVALVAVLDSDPETIIGGGRYIRTNGPGSPEAEIAFTIADNYQGLGLASIVLRELSTIAKATGIKRFIAEVLPTNAAMLRVFRRSGLPMSCRTENGVVHVALDIEASEKASAQAQ